MDQTHSLLDHFLRLGAAYVELESEADSGQKITAAHRGPRHDLLEMQDEVLRIVSKRINDVEPVDRFFIRVKQQSGNAGELWEDVRIQIEPLLRHMPPPEDLLTVIQSLRESLTFPLRREAEEWLESEYTKDRLLAWKVENGLVSTDEDWVPDPLQMAVDEIVEWDLPRMSGEERIRAAARIAHVFLMLYDPRDPFPGETQSLAFILGKAALRSGIIAQANFAAEILRSHRSSVCAPPMPKDNGRSMMMKQDGESVEDALTRLGLECASMIYSNPAAWEDEAKWLNELPLCQAIYALPNQVPSRTFLEVVDSGNCPVDPKSAPKVVRYVYDGEAERTRLQGPIMRRLITAWDAACFRFHNRDKYRFLDFRITDAKRIALLAAFTLNADFDGADLNPKFDWPWEKPSDCEASLEGRYWAWSKIAGNTLWAEEALLELIEKSVEYLEKMLHEWQAAGGETDSGDEVPVGVDVKPEMALTDDHTTILRFMAGTPTLCRTVTYIADTIDAIMSREKVGLLLRDLDKYGLVHRPHGRKKGYILTERGRTMAAQLRQ